MKVHKRYKVRRKECGYDDVIVEADTFYTDNGILTFYRDRKAVASFLAWNDVIELDPLFPSTPVSKRRRKRI